MNDINLLLYYRSSLYIVLFISLWLAPSPAVADVRDDAVFAVSKLHQTKSAISLPDDINSLDDALFKAEMLKENNDHVNADKLYLLILQKARLIESMLGISPTQQPGSSDPDSSANTEITPGQISLPDDVTSTKLIGGTGSYTVVSGDNIRLVAAKLGVTRQHLIKTNGLKSASSLTSGQKLKYNNRKIIPKHIREGIVVNIPDRTLYFFQQGNLVKSLPVALGVSTKNEKYDWQTPVGKFKITAKQKNPTWYVPYSIRSEMEERGKEVKISIPPGPTNPLGKFAIKTSIPGILIHSTTKPWSIYSFSSHGCIRVYPSQMEDFFNEVKINTQGEIIYKPVKLAVTESGKIFLEVHNDIYKKVININDEAKKMIERQNLNERIDWKKFESVTKQKSGVAEDITM